MLVKERMSHPVLTITPDVPVQEALARMRNDKVRRYPVVDKRGKLIGIVTDSDLMNASPSEATTLSVWEINYLLSRITVERVMTRNPITVSEDTTVEEAARIMADNKIGGLPVLRDNRLVGIITETDLFKIFLEMLGARTAGVRVTVEVPDTPGKLHEITGAIYQLGGNIQGMGAVLGETSETRTLTLKVTGVSLDALKSALQPLVEKVVDIREEKGAL
ncbi:CBS and ACT domain-containing protein [Anaerolinea sp.]|jgi:acetoin utilization protein AcuB|uniref:CBS and ACT domain-containing protein n=1 Tax=Anaerolinea sp. TaxID=1872519 RepID=UPI0026121950|nr:CBS and ACT domain-containing protein [uncultured Anaerolinea sp.]